MPRGKLEMTTCMYSLSCLSFTIFIPCCLLCWPPVFFFEIHGTSGQWLLLALQYNSCIIISAPTLLHIHP
ncbi:uncharacterized protein EV154DRAFT_508099 [Mucor mucedo]|uniref:uncharacterized protein n=1 Tax=Mucor mucedo TaxID=29922 RepID=UPI0022203111|nr:uncharacterized protein EV154DRAFT_508099 [Mucor mucedo]KAI7891403.1 hypothetical protein EV154DRAFT_508099 [Mucor mucedo]